jgi:putative hydrolases of HD superfamily
LASSTRKSRNHFLKNPFPLPPTFRDLEMQMSFLTEIEKLKTVYRQNGIIDGTRQENSAEHSWHVAMMAVLLNEYSDIKIDGLKVLQMLLIHDIVEIDAGDTFLYSKKGNAVKAGKEKASAERIFGLLPRRQKKYFIGLWKEFEKRKTPEALFASALDGFHPLLNHYVTGGKWVRKHKLSKSEVLEKKKYIGKASGILWKYSQDLIDLTEKAGIYLNK